MKFAMVTPAPVPRSDTYKMLAWAYAGVLVLMVIGQLFGFEKFIPLIHDYWLPGGNGTATLVASLIVVSEVFALPFLLRMPLSPLMRIVSLACSLLAAGLWIFLGLVAILGDASMTNSGMLGTKVVIPFGIIQLIVALAVGCLAVFSVRGLWPVAKK